MSLRKITSLTLLLSFIPLILTSLVLYVEPEGRVAYWSDWRWLGLSKTQWGDLHINLGFLFLAAGLIHLWLNWKPVVTYLKNKAKEVKILTPACGVALALTVVFILGTLLSLPPFSTILDFGQSFKDAAAEKYGEPPYGHAELSPLAIFVKRADLDLDLAQKGLTEAGIHFSGTQQTILAIAQHNGITPKAVYEALRKTAPQPTGIRKPLPEAPFPGLGRKTLVELSHEYDVELESALAALQQHNIKAKADQTLREIAEANQTDPHALYPLLYEVANK